MISFCSAPETSQDIFSERRNIAPNEDSKLCWHTKQSGFGLSRRSILRNFCAYAMTIQLFFCLMEFFGVRPAFGTLEFSYLTVLFSILKFCLITFSRFSFQNFDLIYHNTFFLGAETDKETIFSTEVRSISGIWKWMEIIVNREWNLKKQRPVYTFIFTAEIWCSIELNWLYFQQLDFLM